jgi:hypothetical protein
MALLPSFSSSTLDPVWNIKVPFVQGRHRGINHTTKFENDRERERRIWSIRELKIYFDIHMFDKAIPVELILVPL